MGLQTVMSVVRDPLLAGAAVTRPLKSRILSEVVRSGEISHVLLIDVDSKLPNLALMKLSAYFKRRGSKVGFHVPTPTLVCVSILFRKNRRRGFLVQHLLPDVPIVYGGPGWDPSVKLPPEVEQTPPDYSMYPDSH